MFGKQAGVRKFALIVFLAAVLMLGGLWTIVWQHIDNEHERTIAEAFREGMNLAKSFEEQVRHIVDTADHDMVLLKMIYEKERYAHSIIDVILQQTVVDPTRFLIGITDEQGYFVVNSEPRTYGLDHSDREWFRFQQTAATDRLYIAKTMISRSSGKAVIPLTPCVRIVVVQEPEIYI